MTARTKAVLIGLCVLISTLVALRVIAAAIWPTINDVRTGATPEYPELQPQRFARPADQVFAAALATAREMGLEVTSAEKGEIRAVATTRVLRFKDDVNIARRRSRRECTPHFRFPGTTSRLPV